MRECLGEMMQVMLNNTVTVKTNEHLKGEHRYNTIK